MKDFFGGSHTGTSNVKPLLHFAGACFMKAERAALGDGVKMCLPRSVQSQAGWDLEQPDLVGSVPPWPW